MQWLSQTIPAFPNLSIRSFTAIKIQTCQTVQKVIPDVFGTDYTFTQRRCVRTSPKIEVRFSIKFLVENNNYKHRHLVTQGSLWARAFAFKLIRCNCSQRVVLESEETKPYGRSKRRRTFFHKVFVLKIGERFFIPTLSLYTCFICCQKDEWEVKRTQVLKNCKNSTFGGMKNAKHDVFQRKIPKLI